MVEKEVKFRITVDDEATAKLQEIKSQMDALNGASFQMAAGFTGGQQKQQIIKAPKMEGNPPSISPEMNIPEIPSISIPSEISPAEVPAPVDILSRVKPPEVPSVNVPTSIVKPEFPPINIPTIVSSPSIPEITPKEVAFPTKTIIEKKEIEEVKREKEPPTKKPSKSGGDEFHKKKDSENALIPGEWARPLRAAGMYRSAWFAGQDMSGKAMKGAAGIFILQAMGDTLKKILEVLVSSSPALQAEMKIMKVALEGILRPMADVVAAVLRPMARRMLKTQALARQELVREGYKPGTVDYAKQFNDVMLHEFWHIMTGKEGMDQADVAQIVDDIRTAIEMFGESMTEEEWAQKKKEYNPTEMAFRESSSSIRYSEAEWDLAKLSRTQYLKKYFPEQYATEVAGGGAIDTGPMPGGGKKNWWDTSNWVGDWESFNYDEIFKSAPVPEIDFSWLTDWTKDFHLPKLDIPDLGLDVSGAGDSFSGVTSAADSLTTALGDLCDKVGDTGSYLDNLSKGASKGITDAGKGTVNVFVDTGEGVYNWARGLLH